MADPHKAAARRARYKLVASMLTTYGYAIIGAALIQPFVMNGKILTALQLADIAVGVVFHALAVYIAPHGEKA